MNHVFAALDIVISIARFIILLGVLIFVHELGHFVAAKLCGVYVVRFSFGWGKRLFGFKRGETDYCISAFPVGGYVKMVGQEDMPRSQEEAEQLDPETAHVPQERRFYNQPTRNKLAISFAGPLMNLLFAFPVFWIVHMVGMQVPIIGEYTWIGGVTEDSPAEMAGIQTGQRVLSINGAPVTKWLDFQLKIWSSENKPLALELEDLSGTATHATVTPVREEDSTRAGIGVDPLFAHGIARIIPGMPADESGLLAGDVILTYNNLRPSNKAIDEFVSTVNQSAGQPMVFTVIRDEDMLDVTVTPKNVTVIENVRFDGNVVAYVDTEKADPAASDPESKDAVTEQTEPAGYGLQSGDVVTAVNGEPLQESDIADFAASTLYGLTDSEVKLTVERQTGFLSDPQTMNFTVPLAQKGMIGTEFSIMTMEKYGPGQAFLKSFGAFGNTFKLMMKTIYYLFTFKVSPREMASPIGIAVMTEQGLKMGGMVYYLSFVAFITINLAIINLLPIPVLDGGMILIASIEALRKKPLEEKYLLFLQRIGVAFILLLIFVAVYNDILRSINYFFGSGYFFE